jgi:tRNA A-37 threonylcarbamoyl transferase component Bud32
MKGDVKDSAVAKVHIGYDGLVHKWYRGPLAKERFENERRVLRHLEERGCPFVPRLLEQFPDELYLVTTNCGAQAPQVSEKKMEQLFQDLETYDVRHEDQAERNVTYSSQMGCFCLIDFEFATILSTGEGLKISDADEELQRLRESGEYSLDTRAGEK